MNLVQNSVKHGGRLVPIVIPHGLTSGTGLMNPSIFIDDDGTIMVNLRHVNYTLYQSENKQIFPSRWGPLSYLHPESDMALRTINYLCRLDEDLNTVAWTRVDTSALDVPPLWEFAGEEDCRLVKWDGQFYLIGVRRDTTTNGEGRMEYSHITVDKENWTAVETKRIRIPVPGAYTYCEKNWVPVLNKPYHFVKWTMPTELVKADPNEPKCEQVFVKPTPTPPADQRGGSQVFEWGNYYVSITHEVQLFNNYLGQKDGIYKHRLIVWDKDFNFRGYSKPFTFMDGRIEFCVGAAVHHGDVLVTFGFQDNAAFVLQVPSVVFHGLLMEALANV